MKQGIKKWSAAGLALLGVGAVTAVAAIYAHSKPSIAAPYTGCGPNGYIFKYQGTPTTDAQAIDMVTGQGSHAGTISGHQFNAVGYNPKDNYFYGWDLSSGTFMRVKSDFSASETLTISGYSGPTANIFSGDVDVDGHYWFFVANTWYEVDLNTSPNPTFVASATPGTIPTGSDGTDWAFMPGTDSLYRAMDNGTNVTIWAFNRTSKSWSSVGVVSNITTAADRNLGAVYADPNNNFYMSSHDSGKLWRVDLTDTAPFTAVALGASDPNSNDGARCALASVPIDFGDAPSTYSTLIDDPSDGGARHSVINFNIFESTAPLMLGKKVDIETDGFPGADADGDDADHQGIPGGPFVDDERGVTHIVATPGSSTPLTVPVYVTNTSGQAATVAGWIDLDNDGSFETGERVSATVPNGFYGYQQLTFPAPPAPYTANTYARFRLFAAGDTSPAATGLLPTGPAAGGEVEDVLVQVGTYDASKTSDPAEGTKLDPGQTVTYTVTIQNTGATALENLKIDDDLTDVLDDATVQGSPTVSPASAGGASVNGNTLEFVGDVGIGQAVTVTYSIKVKDGGTLGNASLHNVILAAHSASCHPVISGSSATVSDPDCQTDHTINGLANTGSNRLRPVLLAGGLLAAAGIAAYYGRRHLGRLPLAGRK